MYFLSTTLPSATAQYDVQIKDLEDRISELEENPISFELYVAFIAIIVTGIIALVSFQLIRQSNNNSKKVSEIVLMMKLNDRIYNSERGKKILEITKNRDAVVVDMNKKEGEPNGPLSHRDVENFLYDIELIFMLKDKDILTSEISSHSFTWILDRVLANTTIINFIAVKQKEYGLGMWDLLSNYYPFPERLKKDQIK